ncbi:MAG: hypothetical protein AB1397_00365 [bacterium]
MQKAKLYGFVILLLAFFSYALDFKKGEVLVKTKDREVITSIGEGFGLLSYERLYEEKDGSVFLLKFPPDSDIKEIIASYKDNENVVYAEPNYLSAIATKNEEKETPLTFQDEPGILEVQEMAIRYNNLSPSVVKSWQKRAKYKVLLPELSFSYGNYVAYGKEGPDQWSLSFDWHLSELIYNPDQTSIDERSRLMTRLRNEILAELTKLYFERKRLILEDKEKNRIRIEELTGLIDGYTGGAFSKKIIDKR